MLQAPRSTQSIQRVLHRGECSRQVLEQFVGSSAGLPASTVTQLTEAWQQEQKARPARDLSGMDNVCVRARKEEKLCLLVLIGVRAGDRDG